MKIPRELSEQLAALMDEVRDEYNLTIKLTQDLFIQAIGSPVIKEDLCNHFDSVLGIDEEPDELNLEDEDLIEPDEDELNEDDLLPREDEDENQD